MKHCDITKPIGLDTLCAEVESTCSKAHIYKRCGLRPQHLIVPLDPGCGRTTFMEYMTDQYKKAGVLEFTSGLDDYIEVAFDGTLPQLKRVFAAIDSAAVYTNEYCNIIGMDISGIAAHLGETQLAEFMKNCKRVCDHACVVFFVHAVPNRNEEKLLEKLCETVGSVKRLTVEPYTKDDMCALIIKAVLDHGIEIRHEAAFQAELSDMVSACCISDVREAIAAADTIVQFADFSGFTPVVDETSLKSVTAIRHNQANIMM